MSIINRYEDGNYEIIEVSKDSETVSSVIKVAKGENINFFLEQSPPPQKPITLEELSSKIDDLTLLILAQQGVIEL